LRVYLCAWPLIDAVSQPPKEFDRCRAYERTREHSSFIHEMIRGLHDGWGRSPDPLELVGRPDKTGPLLYCEAARRKTTPLASHHTTAAPQGACVVGFRIHGLWVENVGHCMRLHRSSLVNASALPAARPLVTIDSTVYCIQ
jgi:hypothetical protein